MPGDEGQTMHNAFDPHMTTFASAANVETVADAYDSTSAGFVSGDSTRRGHSLMAEIHLTPGVKVDRKAYPAGPELGYAFGAVTLGTPGRVAATVYVTPETADAARKLAAALMLAAETVEQ